MTIETSKIQIDIDKLKEEVKVLRDNFEFIKDNNKSLDISKIENKLIEINEIIDNMDAFIKADSNSKKDLGKRIDESEKDIIKIKAGMVLTKDYIDQEFEKYKKENEPKKERLSLFARNWFDTIRIIVPPILGAIVISAENVLKLINTGQYLELLQYVLGALLTAVIAYYFNNEKNTRKIKEEKSIL